MYVFLMYCFHRSLTSGWCDSFTGYAFSVRAGKDATVSTRGGGKQNKGRCLDILLLAARGDDNIPNRYLQVEMSKFLTASTSQTAATSIVVPV